MIDSSPVQPSIFSDMLAPFKPVTEIFADYPIVLTLLIFVVGLIFAGVITSIVVKVFGHMVRKTNIQWDDQVILAFHKPMFWSLVSVGVLLALEPNSKT